MTLKSELQSIDPESVEDYVRAYDEKTTGLQATPEEFEAETLASIRNYPGLNAVVTSITDLIMRNGYTVEEAAMAGMGASMAIGIISEIAEAQNLPSVS